MEAGTVAPAAASTGSKTIADLMALAADRHGAQEAQRFKRDGEWHSVSTRSSAGPSQRSPEV